MTTLSLFEEPAAFEPASRPSAGDVAVATGRPAPVSLRPARAGGLTLPVLAFAALVASPAIWQCLVRHELPPHVMLERYVLIAVGCLAVSEVVWRLLPASAQTLDDPSDSSIVASTGPAAGPDAGLAAAPDAGALSTAVADLGAAGPAPADTLLMQDATDR